MDPTGNRECISGKNDTVPGISSYGLESRSVYCRHRETGSRHQRKIKTMAKKDTRSPETAGESNTVSSKIITGFGQSPEKPQFDETDDLEAPFEQPGAPFEHLVEEEESDGSASAFEGSEIPREEDYRELSDKDLDDILDNI